MPSTTVPSETWPITGEEIERAPGVGPCELLDGRIVPMSPTGGEHGAVELKIGAILRAREFKEPDRLPGDDVLAGFGTSVAALFEE